tara:strand:+ start:1547 stop:2833 length:1287 start_codon:yes stop_codon:yes gene_type:complete
MSASVPEKLKSLVSMGSISEDWDLSAQTMSQGQIQFLTSESVSESAGWCGFDREAIEFLQQAARFISSDTDLTRLAWHCHHLLFVCEPGRFSPWGWTVLTDLLGEYCGAFYLLVILSGIPAIRKVHTDLSIPEQVARDTYKDTLVWAKQYREIGIKKDDLFFHPSKPHVWGVDTRIMPWLLSHLYGHLYRIGRLQYKVGPNKQKLRVYRNKETRAIRLLAESGLRFRGDGHFDGTAGREDPENAWNTKLTVANGRITGTVIHPGGKALREPISLPLDIWELILQEGDQILEIHIPEDGPMDFDACGKSLSNAAEFFPKYFPARPFKAIVCTSWFLDPSYQQLLSESSNIVRFQKECYLFPYPTTRTRNGLERIFGAFTSDQENAPRDTSMRRAVLDHFDRGGILVGGGALILPDSLNWGHQVYLGSFP